MDPLIDLDESTVVVPLSFQEATAASAMQKARVAWYMATGANMLSFQCQSQGDCVDRYLDGECVYDFTVLIAPV